MTSPKRKTPTASMSDDEAATRRLTDAQLRLGNERLEAHARSRGYPPGWTTLSGSLAHDETFTAPPRHPARPVQPLESPACAWKTG